MQPLLKTVCQFLKRVNIQLPYVIDIPLLGIYAREIKTYVCTKTYTQMFIVIVFMIYRKVKTTQMSISGKTGKQNVIHMCNGELFDNTMEWSTATCFNIYDLKTIRPSEWSFIKGHIWINQFVLNVYIYILDKSIEIKF